MKKKYVVILITSSIVLGAYLISSMIKHSRDSKWTEQFEYQESQRDSLMVNYLERNYPRAISLAESIINNVTDSYTAINAKSIYPIYIDMLILMHNYEKAVIECKRWFDIEIKFDLTDIMGDQQPYDIGLAYSYFLAGDFENLEFTLTKIKIENINDEVFFNSSLDERLILGWYLEILIEYKNNIITAKDIINHFDYLSLDLINAKLMADESYFKAIEYLQDCQILFNEGYCPTLSYRKLARYEESNMLLSYLNYKNDDKENALKYFKQSLNKEDGSTFNGDWDFWLNYRGYYKDQYEVLTKIKNIYININDDE